MKIASGRHGSFERGAEDRFTGEVWLRSTVDAPDGTSVGIVHFTPSARTHWHRHPGGQFLFGLTGRGRVRSREGAAHVLEAGDVVYVPAGEWHFHGADPRSPLVHLALNGGGSPTWGDPVSDAAYGEGF